MLAEKYPTEIIIKAKAELYLRELEAREKLALKYNWLHIARKKQLMPKGDWATWLLLAGRGWGKTLVLTQSTRLLIDQGKTSRIAIAARTPADARDVLIEGGSGFLNIFPPWQRPKYEPSKNRITFHTGAVGYIYSSETPDKARGPEHDLVIADELAAWRDMDLWDNLMFGLRQGDAKIIIATTPRPTPLIKSLVVDDKIVKIVGSTFENQGNLANRFLKTIKDKYAGTRLGRQELYAEVLADTIGALWRISNIDKYRLKQIPDNIVRIVIAVDPAVTSNETSDETGIIACGKCNKNEGYVFKDSSMKGTPNEWAAEAIRLYHFYNASAIIAEKNNGGEMITQIIKTLDSTVNVQLVWASVGKRTRAEPVSALYEQGKIHHIGIFSKLEDEMCTWDASSNAKSPNRMDALVWGFTKLMLVTITEPRFRGI